MPAFGDYEPLVSDVRLAPIDDRLRGEFPGLTPEDVLVTFIQPEQVKIRDGQELRIPPMAVLAVMSPNPRHPDYRLMTPGVTSLAAFEEADQEFRHYAGKTDPVLSIYRLVVKDHLRKLQDLRELI